MTREVAKSSCEAQGMSLASADDFVDGETILTYRAAMEYLNQKTIWIGGKANGQCSVVLPLSSDNYIRSWKPCNEPHYAYCEFNCKFYILLYA